MKVSLCSKGKDFKGTFLIFVSFFSKVNLQTSPYVSFRAMAPAKIKSAAAGTVL